MMSYGESAGASPQEEASRLEFLARAALPQFRLPADAKLTLVSQRENAVFRVECDGPRERFALRIHRVGYQDERSIQSELQWMVALRDARVRTPQPVRGVDGGFVQTVACPEVVGRRHCDVLGWIEGDPIGESASLDSFRVLGKLGARMHRHAREWKLPEGFTRQRWDEHGLLGEEPLWGRYADLAALDREGRDLMDRAKSRARERLVAYGKDSTCYGLIHADLMPENVLLSDGDPYVIDFDDSGFGWFMYDLATRVAFQVAEPDLPARVAAWVEGYRSEERLDEAHLAELSTFVMCRLLAVLGWLHTRREAPAASEHTGAIVGLARWYAESFLAAR